MDLEGPAHGETKTPFRITFPEVVVKNPFATPTHPQKKHITNGWSLNNQHFISRFAAIARLFPHLI